MFITVKLKKLFFSFCVCLFLFFASITMAAICDSNDSSIDVPIIMYHSVKNDISDSAKYIVTPNQLESDLIYLAQNGYTTITMTDLIDYVYNDKKLPEKPIILTFDDGYFNNYYYAYPLMKKYNMKMVISVVGSYSDKFSEIDDSNPAYAYLTWNQIKELQASGYAEIQNHTYSMHSIDKTRNGCKQGKCETDEEYEKNLTEDLKKLQNKIYEYTNYMPNTFTYPFGAISNTSKKIIKKIGFKASLSCEEGINKISKDKDCLFKLKRCIRTSEESTWEFFKKIFEYSKT